MWVMLLVQLIPLFLKLIEYLRKKQASGQPLTRRERQAFNTLLGACNELRSIAVKMGLNPDGEQEMTVTLNPEDGGDTSLLSVPVFVQARRMLTMPNTTPEDWDKFFNEHFQDDSPDWIPDNIVDEVMPALDGVVEPEMSDKPI